MFRFNNRNTRALCEILAIKTTERGIDDVGFFIINFGQMSRIDLVYPLLTLNNKMLIGFPLVNLLFLFLAFICLRATGIYQPTLSNI